MNQAVRIVLAALGAAAVLVATLTPAAAVAPPARPTAHTVAPTPLVGPLFFGSTDSDHGCTASVLDSRTRDLILTAAHCVIGTGDGILFVPGYDRGQTPYGVWSVNAAYVAPQWLGTQDTHYDYAVLRVAPLNATRLEDVTGGLHLALAPSSGTRITDIAYNAGINDRPISCSPTVYYRLGFPAFGCHGYVGGSSGSPWLVPAGRAPRSVVGVIGGLHQGGCFDYVSYSSPFDVTALQVLARADSGASSDVVPPAGGDGC